jgi:hypothetical protein
VLASPRLAFMVPWFMAKTSVVPKKRRGPAPTGKGIQVGERWHPSELAAIDAWIASSADKTLTRAHAIRRLVALGLRAKPNERPKSEGTKQRQGTKQRARVLAGAAVDEMTDTSASADDQANRKRRLIKGPEEFQNMRRDRPNQT